MADRLDRPEPVSSRSGLADGAARSRIREAIDRNYAAHFAFIDYLFGTAVKSDRRFPGKYGVLGDYMPPGFVRQQLFPFTWKE